MRAGLRLGQPCSVAYKRNPTLLHLLRRPEHICSVVLKAIKMKLSKNSSDLLWLFIHSFTLYLAALFLSFITPGEGGQLLMLCQQILYLNFTFYGH